MIDTPGPAVVLQRIRNRQIEYLECVSEPKDWLPCFGSPSELINWWEDWFQIDKLSAYTVPTYTPAEIAGLRQFHEAWNRAADAMSTENRTFDQLLHSPHWQDLARSAHFVLTVFALRGKLSEHEELVQ
jgi:hypothetical protein